MSIEDKPTYSYVLYIRSTPQKIWDALTQPELIKQYWFGIAQESTFKKGASWKLVHGGNMVLHTGEILESDPPRKLAMKWRNELRPGMMAEGYGEAAYEIEQANESVKLSLFHKFEKEDAPGYIAMVATGYEQILSSLKSLLETGKALPAPAPGPTGPPPG